MGMPARSSTLRYTAAQVQAFPEDGNRYELVGGELLVNPAPRRFHEIVVRRLYDAVRSYLLPLGFEELLYAAIADITWGVDPEQSEDLLQPDLFVVYPEEVAGEWIDVTRLVLAAEVVSPSSARADRVVKRRTYQRHRVATCWVVDTGAGLVEVWGADDERPAIVTDELTWRWDSGHVALRIPLDALFAPPRVR